MTDLTVNNLVVNQSSTLNGQNQIKGLLLIDADGAKIGGDSNLQEIKTKSNRLEESAEHNTHTVDIVNENYTKNQSSQSSQLNYNTTNLQRDIKTDNNFISVKDNNRNIDLQMNTFTKNSNRGVCLINESCDMASKTQNTKQLKYIENREKTKYASDKNFENREIKLNNTSQFNLNNDLTRMDLKSQNPIDFALYNANTSIIYNTECTGAVFHRYINGEELAPQWYKQQPEGGLLVFKKVTPQLGLLLETNYQFKLDEVKNATDF